MPLTKATIADIVKEEVIGAKQLMKDLLAKKISFYEDQAAAIKQQLPLMASKKFDFGSYYSALLPQLEDIGLEIMTSPSTETARRVRALLADMKPKFQSMTSSEVKAILEVLFDFISYTGMKNTRDFNAHKFDADLYTFTDKRAEDKKTKEVRRLIQDLLIRFVHENSIRI